MAIDECAWKRVKMLPLSFGFVIHLVHVALIAFVALQLFDVFVRHILDFAARFLDDFASRGIDIHDHAPGIAAHEKMRAFAVHPLPNLRRTVQHFVLHVRFVRLIA